jgi:hypothetical protein
MWNSESMEMKDVALKAVMVMPALLLQKPSFKSKCKQHSECLQRRLNLWKLGDFNGLLKSAEQFNLDSNQLGSQDRLNTSLVRLLT